MRGLLQAVGMAARVYRGKPKDFDFKMKIVAAACWRLWMRPSTACLVHRWRSLRWASIDLLLFLAGIVLQCLGEPLAPDGILLAKCYPSSRVSSVWVVSGGDDVGIGMNITWFPPAHRGSGLAHEFMLLPACLVGKQPN